MPQISPPFEPIRAGTGGTDYKRLAKKKGQVVSPRATNTGLVARRLMCQQIARPTFSKPSQVVAWLGAIQAQDYLAALWAVGLRLKGKPATDASIERALNEGSILRTHALRSTWQLVTPADIRWMLALVAPRLTARSGTRDRQLELDARTFRRSNAALAKALRDGEHLTRAELASALADAGISTAGQRLAHILARAELDALICSGVRRGKQSTYALLDSRAPISGAILERDEALAELARRYFRSRGPATVADFAWWSGVAPSDARAGLESVKSSLVSERIDGRTYWSSGESVETLKSSTAYLLPPFDEYLVAYRDREALLNPRHKNRINAGGGLLRPSIVTDGRVIGAWRRDLGRATTSIEIDLFASPTPRRQRAIAAAARRYGDFLGLKVSVSFPRRTVGFVASSALR